jgi:hypothetical protein
VATLKAKPASAIDIIPAEVTGNFPLPQALEGPHEIVDQGLDVNVARKEGLQLSVAQVA